MPDYTKLFTSASKLTETIGTLREMVFGTGKKTWDFAKRGFKYNLKRPSTRKIFTAPKMSPTNPTVFSKIPFEQEKLFLRNKMILDNKISLAPNPTKNAFLGLHGGRENNFAALATKTMTDFDTGWKGLTNTILKKTDIPVTGMRSVMREMTAFGSRGTNLAKTRMSLSKVVEKSGTVGRRTMAKRFVKIQNPIRELYTSNDVLASANNLIRHHQF